MSMGTRYYTCDDYSRSVNVVAWSPDGRYLAAGSSGGLPLVGAAEAVRVWDTQNWKVVTPHHYKHHLKPDFPKHLLQNREYVRRQTSAWMRPENDCYVLQWSPDGEHLFSGLYITFYGGMYTLGTDIESRALPVARYPHVCHMAAAGQFGIYIDKISQRADRSSWFSEEGLFMISSQEGSPDARFVAFGGREGTIEIWDAQVQQLQRTYTGHTREVLALAWSPDGRLMASGGTDRSVRVWNVQTGEESCICDGHDHIVLDICWSPDGRWIASSSWDTTVRIWDVQTGTCIYVYKGHHDPVNSVAWSPDGRLMASGSWDHTMQVWQAL